MQNNELLAGLTIPTEGMERFAPRYSQHWHEAKLTTFYRDKGQLHWSHGEGVPTTTVYFVQREDGRIHVVLAGPDYNMRPILAAYLDPNVKAEVIVCEAPLKDAQLQNLLRFYVDQPLAFIADRHPVHEARATAAEIVADALNPPEPVH